MGFVNQVVMNTCWRCKKEIDEKYGNGMCYDCFLECSHASEVHNSMMKDFDEGELSEEAFDEEYKRRLY